MTEGDVSVEITISGGETVETETAETIHEIQLGEYDITKVGNSRGVNCFKKLNKYHFPSAVGDSVVAYYREEGPDGEPEVVLKPGNNGE